MWMSCCVTVTLTQTRDTSLGLKRGVNALWNQGGAMYPWPIR